VGFFDGGATIGVEGIGFETESSLGLMGAAMDCFSIGLGTSRGAGFGITFADVGDWDLGAGAEASEARLALSERPGAPDASDAGFDIAAALAAGFFAFI